MSLSLALLHVESPLSLTAFKIPENLQKLGNPNNLSHEELKSRQE